MVAGTAGGVGGCLDTGQFVYQKGTTMGSSSLGNGNIENWGESGMADNSQQTDTSTDVDTDDKNQVLFCLFLALCIHIVLFFFFRC